MWFCVDRYRSQREFIARRISESKSGPNICSSCMCASYKRYFFPWVCLCDITDSIPLPRTSSRFPPMDTNHDDTSTRAFLYRGVSLHIRFALYGRNYLEYLLRILCLCSSSKQESSVATSQDGRTWSSLPEEDASADDGWVGMRTCLCGDVGIRGAFTNPLIEYTAADGVVGCNDVQQQSVILFPTTGLFDCHYARIVSLIIDAHTLYLVPSSCTRLVAVSSNEEGCAAASVCII